jgi:hypothetical protein
MLFNLSCERHFQNKGTGNEIFCTSNHGPFFGDYRDLTAFNEPFNGDRNCESNTNNSSYGIPKEGDKNMLTNKKDGEFTITELEVWEVFYLN